jgi:hypothetical protein
VSSGVLLKPKRIQSGSLTENNNRSQSFDSNNDNICCWKTTQTARSHEKTAKTGVKQCESLHDKPGITEVQQMRQSFKIKFNISDTTQPTFSRIASSLAYNVSVLVQDDCAVLLVRESKSLQLSYSVDGGSGFHTIAEGNSSIDYCPYVDYGNNTYAIFVSSMNSV